MRMRKRDQFTQCRWQNPKVIPIQLTWTGHIFAITQRFTSLDSFIFSIWIFFHEHSLITGLQGKGEGNSLTPQYHFHPLHRQLVISQAITEESSTLHIASSQTQTQIFHWSICAESNLNNQMKQGEISQNLNQQTSSPLSLQKNEVFH